MVNTNKLYGFFLSAEDRTLANYFRNYLWNENEFLSKIKNIEFKKYGNDIELILLEFYINPNTIYLKNIKEIERFNKRRKSIGIPIILNDDNFISKSEKERNSFLKENIEKKLDLLVKKIKKNKLDTAYTKLKNDTLNNFI
jgi:hypothetical protein